VPTGQVLTKKIFGMLPPTFLDPAHTPHTRLRCLFISKDLRCRPLPITVKGHQRAALQGISMHRRQGQVRFTGEDLMLGLVEAMFSSGETPNCLGGRSLLWEIHGYPADDVIGRVAGS
jgi:hypothetical protein